MDDWCQMHAEHMCKIYLTHNEAHGLIRFVGPTFQWFAALTLPFWFVWWLFYRVAFVSNPNHIRTSYLRFFPHQIAFALDYTPVRSISMHHKCRAFCLTFQFQHQDDKIYWVAFEMSSYRNHWLFSIYRPHWICQEHFLILERFEVSLNQSPCQFDPKIRTPNTWNESEKNVNISFQIKKTNSCFHLHFLHIWFQQLHAIVRVFIASNIDESQSNGIVNSFAIGLLRIDMNVFLQFTFWINSTST